MQNAGYKTLNNYCHTAKYNSIKYSVNRNLYRPKKRKKNSALAKIAALTFWSTIMFFALAVNTENFLNPVYFNRIKNRNLNLDAKSIYAPTLNYANNLTFLDENLLVEIPSKGREKIVTINSSGENTTLKNEILNILNDYKNIHAGVYIYDYTTGKTVEINQEEIFPSASIIKIPVLLGMFNRAKNLEKEGLPSIDLNKKMTFTEAHRTEGSGKMQYGSANVDYSLDYLAKVMIRSSDNSATNMLIEEIGGINELNASLRHWGFKKTQVSNWLPDLQGTNTTTPKDIATMLYNIDNQKFIPTKYASEIKEYMSHVENQSLIKSQIPDDAILMHKTGDIGTMLGDAGIVITPNSKKYIIVVMAKRPHNDYGAREVIQKISKAAYEALN